MSVIATITTSVDGYVTGPGDGPGCGLGVGGDLAAGCVDELVVSTAPVILGAGKALFDGFEHDIDLEIRRVYTSEYATHVRYAIKR